MKYNNLIPLNEHKKEVVLSPSIIIFCSLLFAISFIGESIPFIRYVKYAILPVILIVMPMGNNFSQNIWMRFNVGWLILLTYSFVGIFFQFLWHDFSYVSRGFKDIYFILCFLIPLMMFCIDRFPVKESWIVLILCWIISLLFRETGGSISFIKSEAIFESPASFVFGGYAVYALHKKERWFLAINLALMLISLKRIAIIAFLVVSLLYCLPDQYKKKILHPLTFVIVVLSMFLLILAFSAGYFDNIIYGYFKVRSNTLSMGRFWLYQGIYNDIKQNPEVLIWGKGIGQAYNLINEYVLTLFEFKNLHSDILKLGYELGLIVLALFSYLVFQLRSPLAKSIIVYIFICFLTDNIIIFSHIMFFLLAIAYSEEISILRKEGYDCVQ